MITWCETCGWSWMRGWASFSPPLPAASSSCGTHRAVLLRSDHDDDPEHDHDDDGDGVGGGEVKDFKHLTFDHLEVVFWPFLWRKHVNNDFRNCGSIVRWRIEEGNGDLKWFGDIWGKRWCWWYLRKWNLDATSSAESPVRGKNCQPAGHCHQHLEQAFVVIVELLLLLLLLPLPQAP